MERWLRQYEPSEEDYREDRNIEDVRQPSEERQKIRSMKPQATLDLHGRTAAEAGALVNAFLDGAAAKGYTKVLIIHGKGHHSSGSSVLTRVVAESISRHPLAGENGFAGGREGGRGARWVLIKNKRK